LGIVNEQFFPHYEEAGSPCHPWKAFNIYGTILALPLIHQSLISKQLIYAKWNDLSVFSLVLPARREFVE